MPLLVEHFIEHKHENKDITFYQFLYMHYAMGCVRDADYAKDMKLPFKTHDNCLASIINVYLPSQKVVITKPVQFIENQHFKTQEPSLQSTFLSNIWQPPRICSSYFNQVLHQQRVFGVTESTFFHKGSLYLTDEFEKYRGGIAVGTEGKTTDSFCNFFVQIVK